MRRRIKQKGKSSFSFVIVPPSGNKTWTFRVKKWAAYGTIIGVIMFFLILGISIFTLSNFGSKLIQFNIIKKHTTQQKAQFLTIEKEIEELKNNVQVIIEQEEDIQEALGQPSKRKKKDKISQKFIKEFKLITAKKSTIDKRIECLRKYINRTQPSIAKLTKKVDQYQHRFASTPSIWPVYGYILSKFGWRTHPITRKRAMHRGIDIPAWYGAPIRVTGDGVVKYAGWSGTFGYVVIVDHGFGYRTIYAHSSQVLVHKYQTVKKGQVIAQVGNSGFSTGPHLHYEVRKWNIATNPQPYLNLDMFTASTRIW
ncbi:peptidoglycan DD-metalloendopeptidase family protein [Thermoproteota archaeon]